MMTRRVLLGMATLAPLASGKEKPVKLEPDRVRSFVGKSHSDFDTVKAMLAEEPALVNAAWDWGGGDWETGLGAASHTGRRNIAELLLDNDARIDAFAAVMLGEQALVSALLRAYPALPTVPGPHGISLLSHSVYGREAAWKTFELVLGAGADVNAASNNGRTPLMDAALIGHLQAAEELLEAGADQKLTDVQGRTALDYAVEREREAVARLLRSV